jgi:DNA-binding HxlR family transcriptional regulator
LKDLQADHVLARTDYKEVPPRVDYALTPLGRSLADAIVPLCTWGVGFNKPLHLLQLIAALLQETSSARWLWHGKSISSQLTQQASR